MIHLLCQQATISITNALLFRSVQAGTRENLRMIDTQKKALAIARQSREDALKAAKVSHFGHFAFSPDTQTTRLKAIFWHLCPMSESF